MTLLTPYQKMEVGPVLVFRAANGCWRWWCSDDNTTNMGSILASTPRDEVGRLALAHVRAHHKDVYQQLMLRVDTLRGDL